MIRTFRVSNWDKFQHYKKRSDDGKPTRAPTWIKNYTTLLNDPAYRGLSSTQRALLHALWLWWGSRDLGDRFCDLSPTSLEMLNNVLATNAKMSTWEALRDAGFVEISASTATEDSSPPASQDQTQTQTNTQNSFRKKADRSSLRVAFSADKEREIGKILELTDGSDGNSFKVLREIAQQLPLGSIAKVRESVEIRRAGGVRVGVGYAVEALRSEVTERMSA